MISEEIIMSARSADLYQYMINTEPENIINEGTYARLKNDHKIVFKKGFAGFYDNSTGAHGNSIDFLVGYREMSFLEAVKSLTGIASQEEKEFRKKETDRSTNRAKELMAPEEFQIPDWMNPTPQKYSSVFAYLINTRGIPADIVSDLIKRGKLYQDRNGNCVFYDAQERVYEIRGTNTSTPFKGIKRFSKESFWSFYTGEQLPAYACVCESAIDAISLYVLMKKPTNCTFVSLAGCKNQAIIDRLKKTGILIILATDNDHDGQEVIERNPDIRYFLRPVNKDWNEDLLSLRNIPN